jgi:tetratricopeptide (TPR) repeat protein
MNVRGACFAFALLLACSLTATAGPRVSFVRVIPAPHDLGAQSSIALIYAIGSSDRISTFLDVFSDHTGRELHFENAIEHRQHLLGNHIDEAGFKALRRDHPADVYLGINQFTCTFSEHEAEGSERDVDGERVKRPHVWADATCTARIDVLSGATGKRTLSFAVRGEGTSPRVAELTAEERNIALDQAARYAAIEAQENITPRKLRESIELDDTAPSFEEGLAMIVGSRFDDARAIWEAALRRHESSAALQYDLGAVCEAMGDLRAARDYYQQALRLSPAEKRYRVELDLFRKRNGASRTSP